MPATLRKKMSDGSRVRFSRPHINGRSKPLVDYGLLLHLHLVNGAYDIAREGEQYLVRELDGETLGPD